MERNDDNEGRKKSIGTPIDHLMAMGPPSKVGRLEPLKNFESLEVKNDKKALSQSMIHHRSTNFPGCSTSPEACQSMRCA